MATTAIVTATAGILIGYFSSEAPTVAHFERLFWPQRFYYAIDPLSLLKAAVLMPVGAVLHKAVLETLDQLQESGLLALRRGHGHMLGTVFYHDVEYQLIQSDGELQEARNGFLISILEYCAQNTLSRYLPQRRKTRSIQTVCLLTLFVGNSPRTPKVSLAVDTRKSSLRPLLGIFASESVAVGLGLWAAISYKTWFASLWFIPVFVKALSMFLSLRREPLDAQLSVTEQTDISNAHLYHRRDGFMILRGHSKILNQFSTHYGHPIRSKSRELLYILFLVVLDLVYPCGTIFLSWVPTAVQIAWLSYLLFVTCAMHIYRYGGGELVGSIQEVIGNALLAEGHVCLDVGKGVALQANLTVTVVDSVAEGRGVVSKLLNEFLDLDRDQKTQVHIF